MPTRVPIRDSCKKVADFDECDGGYAVGSQHNFHDSMGSKININRMCCAKLKDAQSQQRTYQIQNMQLSIDAPESGVRRTDSRVFLTDTRYL